MKKFIFTVLVMIAFVGTSFATTATIQSTIQDDHPIFVLDYDVNITAGDFNFDANLETYTVKAVTDEVGYEPTSLIKNTKALAVQPITLFERAIYRYDNRMPINKYIQVKSYKQFASYDLMM